jgi:hypothetical protein
MPSYLVDIIPEEGLIELRVALNDLAERRIIVIRASGSLRTFHDAKQLEKITGRLAVAQRYDGVASNRA